MNATSTIQLELALEYTIKQLFPILDDVIRCPYELIDQIIKDVEKYPSRKLFYKILGKDHLKDTETLEYIIKYDDIYPGSKNAKSRGVELLESIRRDFQHQSFKVSQEFAAMAMRVKINASATYISPFEAVSFSNSAYEVKLTKAFKLYLHVLRLKEYAKVVPFAKGDERLLTSFRIHHTDKLYWIIRRHQWARGTITYKLADLKTNMGCEGMANKSFFALLSKIEGDLIGTWSEFSHRKIRKGKFVKEIEIKFNSDNINREKNRLDLRFEYEEELRSNGVDIDTIYNIRKLIAVGETIEKNGKHYEWSPFYVMQTIDLARRNNFKAKRDFRNLPGYIIKALFQGYWVEMIDNLKSEAHNYGLFGKQVKRGISVTAKAIPIEDLEITASESGKTLEEYKNMLNRQGRFYCEYMDYQTGRIYLVPEDHVKRLKVLQTKEALKRAS